jgi:hypothetical protein
MTLRLIALATATACAAALAAPAALAVGSPASGEWVFRVLLDDKPIGEHRFTLSAQGERRQLRSVAAFDVKFLGFSAYRYRLDVTEQWQGDCLTALSANTDDDGKRSSVMARSDGDNKLRIASPTGEQAVDGCLMSFAYWNPGLRSQTRLLDPAGSNPCASRWWGKKRFRCAASPHRPPACASMGRSSRSTSGTRNKATGWHCNPSWPVGASSSTGANSRLPIHRCHRNHHA